MRILLIDNHDSFTYNLAQLLEETGLCKVTVRPNDAPQSSLAGPWAGIVLSPGPGIPREAGPLLSLIRDLGGKVPVLGICLGHQAIVESFGGTIRRMPEVAHGVQKRVEVVDEGEGLFAGLPRPFLAGLYHSWEVDPETLPPSLIVTARSSDGTIMAVAHETLDVRGLQFHPESILTPEGSSLVGNWLRRLER